MAKGQEGNKVRTITCKACGVSVTKRMPPRRKYCSQECYRSAPKAERRTGEDRTCDVCGTGFYVPRSRVEKGEGRFCSLACHNLNQGRDKTTHTCKMCGGEFRWSPSRSASGNYRITYCSLACRNADPEHRAHLLRMNELQQSRKMTQAEALGYSLLELADCEYLAQTTFAGKFTPDAVVPAARLVVQFDGDYWHDRKGTSTEARIVKRVALDRSQDAYARACGWEVIRFWESDLRGDFGGCMARLSQAISRPLGGEPARDPLARA